MAAALFTYVTSRKYNALSNDGLNEELLEMQHSPAALYLSGYEFNFF